MENKKKTYIDEMDRGIYDVKNEDSFSFKSEKGLTKDIIETISEEKNEAKWMRDFRLRSLEIYNKLKLPTWGPSLDELDMDNIVTYVRPKSSLVGSWDEVPEDIKKNF